MPEGTSLNIISKTPEIKKFEHPLLFIHGMFQGSWVWEEHFLDYFLEKGHECHLLNLRGHNGSLLEGWFRFISINDYVEDLKTAITSIETSPILIGHSMGGFVIQKYLEDHDAPLSILMSPVPPRGVYEPTFKVMKTKPHLFLLGNLILSLSPIVRNKKLMKKLMFTMDMDEELYDKLYPQHQNESYRAYLDMLLFKWVKTKKISSRLEIIGCEKDYSVTAKAVRRTAEKYGIDAMIFGNRGHCAMIEEGWEEVADYILDRISAFETESD